MHHCVFINCEQRTQRGNVLLNTGSVKGAIALGKKIVKVWMMMMKEGIFAGHPPLALPTRGDGNASHTYLFGLHSTLITHYIFLKHNLSDLGRTNKRNMANAIFEVLKDLTDSERSD